MKCCGCGAEKDMSVLETYPFPEDEIFCNEPIQPLLNLECQPKDKSGEWKLTIVCHECFKKLDPDMWISENCWIGINPIITFDKLPSLKATIGCTSLNIFF